MEKDKFELEFSHDAILFNDYEDRLWDDVKYSNYMYSVLESLKKGNFIGDKLPSSTESIYIFRLIIPPIYLTSIYKVDAYLDYIVFLDKRIIHVCPLKIK